MVSGDPRSRWGPLGLAGTPKRTRTAQLSPPAQGQGFLRLGSLRLVFGFRGLPVGFLGHDKNWVCNTFLFTNNYNFKSSVVLAEDLLSQWVHTIFGSYLQVVGQLHHFLKGKGRMFKSNRIVSVYKHFMNSLQDPNILK